MASGLAYYAADVQQAKSELGNAMRGAAKKSMQSAMKQSEADAQRIYHWRRPGRYEKDYPSGHWVWEVTGMSAASIKGYVVPEKELAQLPTTVTTSYHDGVALHHTHYTDDGVTSDYGVTPDIIKGVLTMNIAYAPYLQEYEIDNFGEPVVIEVLEANWDSYYVPSVIAPEIEHLLQSVISQFT